MTDHAVSEHDGPYPSGIKLHQRTAVLEVSFGDGSCFMLPAEYLRVYSPSADNKVADGRGQAPTGKENVKIARIVPVGNYAIRLYFTDGHDTGVYSWQRLHELGERQRANWQAYLERLQAMGYQRNAGGNGHLKLLYFDKLLERLGRDSEEVDVPGSVTDVASLLAWLRSRGGDWETYLADAQVEVTVNREFAEPDNTPVKDGDEIAIVPARPR